MLAVWAYEPEWDSPAFIQKPYIVVCAYNLSSGETRESLRPTGQQVSASIRKPIPKDIVREQWRKTIDVDRWPPYVSSPCIHTAWGKGESNVPLDNRLAKPSCSSEHFRMRLWGKQGIVGVAGKDVKSYDCYKRKIGHI